MQQMRLDSKDGIASGWAGAGISDARKMPDRVRANASAASRIGDDVDEQTNKRGWASVALHFARNALVGLVLLTAVPVAIVGWRSQHLSYNDYNRPFERVGRVERFRPLMAAKDPAITPLQAGMAFHALQSYKQNKEFPMVPVASSVERPWRTHRISADLFASSGPRMLAFDGPSPQHIVESVPGGFSETELAWLRTVADAPVWKDFDKVGAANAVDLIGGQYQLPFRDDAFAVAMPTTQFANTKELAYAGVSRAAYYLAIGQPAKSEAALRSIVSFGFVMIDNANSTIDALIGSVIVNIGRNGLEQFDVATHGTNVLAHDVPGANSTQSSGVQRRLSVSSDQLHQRLLTDAANKDAPRGLRMEQLNQLSFATCTNIPEMIFGPSEETRAAFANAKTTLARYPSEQALLDLMLDATNRVPEKEIVKSASERLIMGAAAVASTVTGNPRFAACTRIASNYW